ncbi:hypothetical protein [Serratia sp. UGAL515B_01]
MVKCTQEEAEKIKVTINSTLIYPPKAEREAAFAAAEPLTPLV